MPSVINVINEIDYFISLGRINFPDEVTLGNALSKVYQTPAPAPENIKLPEVHIQLIRKIVTESENGYLPP